MLYELVHVSQDDYVVGVYESPEIAYEAMCNYIEETRCYEDDYEINVYNGVKQ